MLLAFSCFAYETNTASDRILSGWSDRRINPTFGLNLRSQGRKSLKNLEIFRVLKKNIALELWGNQNIKF